MRAAHLSVIGVKVLLYVQYSLELQQQKMGCATSSSRNKESGGDFDDENVAKVHFNIL